MTLRVGIIGGGRITGMHALAYHDYPKAEIYALCDANEQVARDRAQEWNVQHWFTDYREMLADEAIDAVEIITPHHLHAEMTVHALEAGKDVSVQKPMALEVAECDAMIDAARRTGKNLRVFENFQHFPPLAKAKQLLDAGAIGDPISLRMKAIQGSLDGGDESTPPLKRADARPPYPLPLSHQVKHVNPDNWKFDPKQGGGGRMALDYGYHVFGLAVHLLGDVEKVFAWITQQEIVHGWILDSPRGGDLEVSRRRTIWFVGCCLLGWDSRPHQVLARGRMGRDQRHQGVLMGQSLHVDAFGSSGPSDVSRWGDHRILEPGYGLRIQLHSRYSRLDQLAGRRSPGGLVS